MTTENNPIALDEIADCSYAEQSLGLLIGATDEFLEKAEAANRTALANEDEDNPEPPPFGEEVIRADALLEAAQELQETYESSPPKTDEAALEFEKAVKGLVRTGEDIYGEVPQPSADTEEDEPVPVP